MDAKNPSLVVHVIAAVALTAFAVYSADSFWYLPLIYLFTNLFFSPSKSGRPIYAVITLLFHGLAAFMLWKPLPDTMTLQWYYPLIVSWAITFFTNF